MIWRKSINYLNIWKNSPGRKPLIIRGARQTGKTTLVEVFSEQFESFIKLNLETYTHKQLFTSFVSIKDFIQSAELLFNKKIIPGKTLILIDEIQEVPSAVKWLRYFYEEMPSLHIIATGSLLDAILSEEKISFPVGRTQFYYLHPLTFDEYLQAMGENLILEELRRSTLSGVFSEVIHQKLLILFYEFCVVGGMPEVVRTFMKDKSFMDLNDIKESLMTSFESDVLKYEKKSHKEAISLLIQKTPHYVGSRITYHRFAESEFQSREMKRAFEKLEQAMIIQRVFGTYRTQAPLDPVYTVSPKLFFFDTGLVCHRLQLTSQQLTEKHLDHEAMGALAEQIVYCEMAGQYGDSKNIPCFWYKKQKGSVAECDFVIQAGEYLVPVEVKAGTTGRLRSLASFMDLTPHHYAVRIYSGPLKIDEVKTIKGKPYKLLSLPFYLTFRLNELVLLFIGNH